MVQSGLEGLNVLVRNIWEVQISKTLYSIGLVHQEINEIGGSGRHGKVRLEKEIMVGILEHLMRVETKSKQHVRVDAPLLVLPCISAWV